MLAMLEGFLEEARGGIHSSGRKPIARQGKPRRGTVRWRGGLPHSIVSA